MSSTLSWLYINVNLKRKTKSTFYLCLVFSKFIRVYIDHQELREREEIENEYLEIYCSNNSTLLNMLRREEQK